MKPLSDLSDDELVHLAQRAEKELPAPPQWLVESAMAMWRTLPTKPSLSRRIVAVLGFDSWAAQPAPALRSAPPATRHLLFSANERDIDVRVSAASTGFAIAGQVLGPGDGGAVTLLRNGQDVGTVSLDEFGEFRFAELVAGAYVLTVRFGGDEIVLPPIDLGDASQP